MKKLGLAALAASAALLPGSTGWAQPAPAPAPVVHVQTAPSAGHSWREGGHRMPMHRGGNMQRHRRGPGAHMPPNHPGRPHMGMPHVRPPHAGKPHVRPPHMGMPHVRPPHVRKPHVRMPHGPGHHMGGHRFRHIKRIDRGFAVPHFWFGPQFHIRNWGNYGFPQPHHGGRWIRYYDDALMIDHAGRVMDGRYGFDWDRYGDDWGYDDSGIPVYAGDDDYYEDDVYADGPYPERCDCGPGYGRGGYSGYGGYYVIPGMVITETTVTTEPTVETHVYYEKEAAPRRVVKKRRTVRRSRPAPQPGERG